MNEKTSQNTSKLRKLRDDYRLTQSEIGELLGVSQQYVAQIEAGDRPLPVSYHEELSRIRGELRSRRESDRALMEELISNITEDDIREELIRMRLER